MRFLHLWGVYRLEVVERNLANSWMDVCVDRSPNLATRRMGAGIFCRRHRREDRNEWIKEMPSLLEHFFDGLRSR